MNCRPCTWIRKWWPFALKRTVRRVEARLQVMTAHAENAKRAGIQGAQALRKAETALLEARDHHLQAIRATDDKKAMNLKYQQVKQHLRLFRIAAGAHCDRLREVMTADSTNLTEADWNKLTEDVEALESMNAINVDGRSIIELRQQWLAEVKDNVELIASEEEALELGEKLEFRDRYPDEERDSTIVRAITEGAKAAP